MELRPIYDKNGDKYYPQSEVWKVLIRRFLIALAIVLIGIFLLWAKIKNWFHI